MEFIYQFFIDFQPDLQDLCLNLVEEAGARPTFHYAHGSLVPNKGPPSLFGAITMTSRCIFVFPMCSQPVPAKTVKDRYLNQQHLTC